MILYKLKQNFKQLYEELCKQDVHLYTPTMSLNHRWVRLKNYPATTYFFCFVTNGIANVVCEMGATEFEPCNKMQIRETELSEHILDVSCLRLNKKGLRNFASSIQRIRKFYRYLPVLVYDLYEPLERPIAQPLYRCKSCKCMVTQLYSTMDYPEERFDEVCNTCFDQLEEDYENIISHFDIVCIP